MYQKQIFHPRFYIKLDSRFPAMRGSIPLLSIKICATRTTARTAEYPAHPKILP